MDKIDRLHASLQCALNDWIERSLPGLASDMTPNIETRTGTCINVDSITLRMADSSIATLRMALEAGGLKA